MPHLLKSTRNNLKKHNIEFNNNLTAKWEYITKFFDLDQQQKYRQAPRLTKKHVMVTGLGNMSVKLATQTLSHSVAAGICVYSSIGGLPKDAAFTADFVGEMNSLFDSLNSKTIYSSTEYGGAVTSKSKHVEFWKEKLNFVKSWHIVNERTGKKLVPPCQKGWILTINSVIQIWEHISSCFDFLLTNRLNQDCLENTFSSLRRRGGFRDNPNPFHFHSAIKSQMIHTMIKRSSSSNCEDDNSTVLLELSNCSSNTMLQDNFEVSDKPISSSNIKEFLPNFNADISIYDENVLAYVSGFIANNILKNSNCEICKNMLLGSKDVDMKKLLLYFKEFKETEYGLKWPSNCLLDTIKILSDIFYSEIDHLLFKNNIGDNLYHKMSIVNFEWFLEHEHKDYIKKCILITFIKLMLRYKVKLINSDYLSVDRSNLSKNMKYVKHI